MKCGHCQRELGSACILREWRGMDPGRFCSGRCADLYDQKFLGKDHPMVPEVPV